MNISYKSHGALVTAVKLAKANPAMLFPVPRDFPMSAQDILLNFHDGLMKRCNRGLHVRDDDAYVDLLHDARVINDAARRIRWPGRNLLRNPKMIRRYPHIHNPPMDD